MKLMHIIARSIKFLQVVADVLETIKIKSSKRMTPAIKETPLVDTKVDTKVEHLAISLEVLTFRTSHLMENKWWKARGRTRSWRNMVTTFSCGS